MKLQQLQYVLEIARQGFHISAAARALYTSQPAVSRELRALENELGFPIFERTPNRIVGITDAGQVVVETAKRVIGDIESLTSLKDDLLSSDRGVLTIATTHTHANYVLPKMIGRFIEQYPDVQVVLRQGDPVGICQMADSGEVDIALGTEIPDLFPGLVELPCFELPRVVVTPVDHPLAELDVLTLEDVARYPIITYDRRFSGYRKVQDAFAAAGQTPEVMLSAIDAGVCKTYVAMGLGIAILTEITVDESVDRELRVLPAAHLFASSTSYVKLRPNTYPRRYLVDFVQMIAPQYSAATIREHMAGSRGPD